jgi:AcrR family transcriptional regulator
MKGYSFMQYLKEEIKTGIINAALKEFEVKGFEKASMQNISSNAGVAIGNIYRYFKNKEELFNQIMDPVHNLITALVFDQFMPNPSSEKIRFDPLDIVNSVMKVYLSHSKELMIMMYKSEGTNYSNTKNELISLVEKRLMLEFSLTLSKQNVYGIEVFIHVFATTLVEGIFLILQGDGNVEEKKKQINQLLIFYFNKLDERFK